ncbi:MAG: outer membrane beta-barrel protein [Limisphaerales bacterium]
MNKWTLGLAAVGLVSLTSAVRADEAKTTPLLTALSATTISGYVDTSMEWNPGTGNANPAPYSYNAGKQDGFNLDSVNLHVAKPLEEGQWSSGYVVDLMFGPDTGGSTGSSTEHVRQAYVNLRMPIGNGLDWKIGRFDSPLGYESTDGYKNPNFTRSYGYTFEPTENTGVLAEYKVCDAFALSAGVANTVSTAGINQRNTSGDNGYTVESKKAYIGMVNLTAPESWGAIGGSGLYAGIEYGPGASGGTNTVGAVGTGFSAENRTQLYVGATIKTPVQGLTLGASWDSISHMDVAGADTGYNTAVAAYASFKLSEKASLHLRGEYARGAGLGALADSFNGTGGTDASGTIATGNQLHKVIALTGTLQYDLWQNVISRLEVRWDHQADGAPDAFGGTSNGAAAGEGGAAPSQVFNANGSKKNEVMVAANLIFKF